MSSHYEWTGLVLGNSRVDRVRFSIKAVFVVFVVGYKMSSSRVKSLRVDTTRLRELSSRQSVCGGGINCRRVVSSRYEWTQLVLGNCRVDRVC